MPTTGNRNKIYTTLILCMSIVVSIWLLQREPGNASTVKNSNASVETVASTATSGNDSWKSILVAVDPKFQQAASILSQKNQDSSGEMPEDTTVTAQLAKDFLSQYLLFKQGGTSLTPSDIDHITKNALSLPQYTKTTGAVYVASNLHIQEEGNTTTFKAYKDAINAKLQENLGGITKDKPMSVLLFALQTKNENQLSGLDPIIAKGRKLISDFLVMEVPREAVVLHLSVLNTSSSVLADLEAMRQVFSDPIRAFPGITQYSKHISEFQNSLLKLNSYLDKKV
jgi:hypothetical protein